jgi:hypothetical protein
MSEVGSIVIKSKRLIIPSNATNSIILAGGMEATTLVEIYNIVTGELHSIPKGTVSLDTALFFNL